MNVQGQTSSSDLVYKYDAPEVWSIKKINESNLVTSGLIEEDGDPYYMEITGINFGGIAALQNFSVLLQATDKTYKDNFFIGHINVTHLDHTSVKFKMVEGQGKNLNVHVSVLERLSEKTQCAIFI